MAFTGHVFVLVDSLVPRVSPVASPRDGVRTGRCPGGSRLSPVDSNPDSKTASL